MLNILVDDGQVRGLVAMNMMEGTRVQIRASADVIATGGAGRVYRYNTNGGIVTGDGMGMAFHLGVPLRDMEFVQYHPTGLPGSGILMTEGCRGEGGILVNKDGYRYLQDYDKGPETPLGVPRNTYMDWARGTKFRKPSGTNGAPDAPFPHRAATWFILTYLAWAKESGWSGCHSSVSWLRPTSVSIRLRIRSRYVPPCTGIETAQNCETRINSLFAVGECSSVGLHGANRLGSNSLA